MTRWTGMDEKSVFNVRNIYIALCLVVCILLSVMQKYIVEEYSALPAGDYTINGDGFRTMHFGENVIATIFDYSDEINMDPYELMVVLMIDNKFDLENVNIHSYSKTELIRFRNKIIRKYPNEFAQLKDSYKSIFSNLSYFPVPKSTAKRKWVSYVDSWGSARTYGGERTHEGTDIMALENTRGIYPILSISNGTIANIGWLEQGGYRIGILAENGAYLYYAHMASYAPGIKNGDSVIAGQFLGYMGDTGYSVVEGTTGKFDVHLHFGIYLNETADEISINPYWILRYLENKTLYYSY